MCELYLLRIKNYPIVQQLQLEEALLRADERNFCLINEGSPPAVVMGISGKSDELLHTDKVTAPVIKRFSGGGTVVVDEATLFVTLLGQNDTLPCKAFPREIMQWTEELYRPVFRDLPFSLRENDYVLANRKFGGNAQSLVKGRWLHHSTLLWDYSPERMDWLKLPHRRPEYRQDRRHDEFLCTLRGHVASQEVLADRFEACLSQQFVVKTVSLEELLPVCKREHRRATQLLT